MDALEEAIAAKLREAEARRKKAEAELQKAEQAENEARILQRAAELRPSSPPPDTADRAPQEHSYVLYQAPSELADRPKRGGRQPGAISMRWRRILSTLATFGDFDLETLVLAAESEGVLLKGRSARARVLHYIEAGILMESGDLFSVAPAAAERFGLLHENEAGNSASETGEGSAVSEPTPTKTATPNKA